MFAQATYDEQIQKEVREYTDLSRLKKGLPDYPLSLMEGISGQICFLSDLLRDKDVKIPGYEI